METRDLGVGTAGTTDVVLGVVLTIWHPQVSLGRPGMWHCLPDLVPAAFFAAFLCILSSLFACVHAKSLQSCPTLFDPIDCSPPSSSVHGILQARIVEWIATILQGIIPTQGSNLHLLYLLHWQADSLLLELPGKPFYPV